MQMSKRIVTDEQLDELLKSALHNEADHLEVSIRLKEQIDKEISNRIYGYNFGNMEQKRQHNFATVCLDLYESVEDSSKEKGIYIKCVPKEDAFNRDIMLTDAMYWALEVLMLELIFMFGTKNEEIMISTTGKSISINGMNIQDKNIKDLCHEEKGKYLIKKNTIGLSMAYLRQRGINITVSDENEVLFNICD